jgi:hypothetical protein
MEAIHEWKDRTQMTEFSYRLDATKQVKLGVEALEYIRQRLSNGNTLARHLLAKLDLEKGVITTFLPKKMRKETANDFSTGKFPETSSKNHLFYTAPDGRRVKIVPKPNTNQCLVSLIQVFLRQREEYLCVFENALAEVHDPCVTSFKSSLMFLENEVYHFLFHSDAKNDEKILKTIKEATSWLFIGAMTSIPKRQRITFKTHQKITSGQLKLLAEMAKKIMVGAYDGEGYLIWNNERERGHL